MQCPLTALWTICHYDGHLPRARRSFLLLLAFVLPALIWGTIFAGLGSLCWGGDLLDPNSSLHRAFNSWAAAAKVRRESRKLVRAMRTERMHHEAP